MEVDLDFLSWYFLSIFIMSVCYTVISLIMVYIFDTDREFINTNNIKSFYKKAIQRKSKK